MSIQISISNAIGSRYRGTVVPPIDPDAQAFITAASITDPTQQTAINNLVTGLKTDGLWTKMKALYPFVGGTASAHKFNLKDPRDLDAAFRLVFSGGWTHSNTGAKPNGVNAQANSYLSPGTSLINNNTHLSYYSRTNITGIASMDIGSHWSAPGRFQMTLAYNSNFEADQYNFSTGRVSTAISDTRGFFISSRINSNTHKAFRNSIQLGSTNTGASANILASAETIKLASGNSFYSPRETAFASIGDGLTDTEAANLYTRVQAYQTELGRSIGTQTVSDADAQAFVTNAGIVDQVEANAINNLVIGLKADGLWTKMKACYPMVGGSSSTMKYNLKNPLDTDAAFRLVFNGGWTFSSTGATPNGTNAYANSYFTPSVNLSANSAHISYYSRSASTSTTDNYVIGANSAVGFNAMILRNNVKTFRITNTSTAFEDATNNTALATSGLFLGTQNISDVKLFRSGSNIAQNSATAAGSLMNIPLFIGATNSNTLASSYTTAQTAFVSIGDYLTDTEAANLYTRVQTFNTALSRQV